MDRNDVAVPTVERLDHVRGEWETFPSMVHPRFLPSAAATNGYLYMCGGSGSYNIALRTVERFDSRRGAWERMPSMNSERYGSAAATIAGSLYVIGGCTGYDVIMHLCEEMLS